MLLLIYGCLDGRALRVGKPISFSARCQAFYRLLRKVHEHSIANYLSIISTALVLRVVQRATASVFLGRAEFQELVSLGITELCKLRGLVVSKFHTSLWAVARLEVTS